MRQKNVTTPKQNIIEIADYIFTHPEKKREVILSYFVGKCRKNERTIERYIKQAREYNKTRIQKREKAKNEVLVASAIDALKNDITTRYDCLEILSTIARGDVSRTVRGDEDVFPSDGDRIRAISQMAKMEGWEAPIKNAETDAQGYDKRPSYTKEQLDRLIDKL